MRAFKKTRFLRAKRAAFPQKEYAEIISRRIGKIAWKGSFLLSERGQMIPSRCGSFKGSHLENDGEDERALGGLFVDVAFQVHADFFLDDAPVGFFLRIGLLDGLQNDVARAVDELLAVVAGQKAARHDLRLRFEPPGVFVNGEDGDDDAGLREVFAVADDDVLDLFERAGVHANAARGYRFGARRAFLGELDGPAVFDEQNLTGDDAELMGQGGVAEELPVLAVNRNEITRPHELQEQFLLFLAAMPGNVNRSGAVVVVDQRAPPEHVVQHAENGLFVSRNDASRQNDRVVFLDGDETVIVHGDAGERGHRLGLAAAGEDDQALLVERADILRAHDHAVGDAQAIERVRN